MIQKLIAALKDFQDRKRIKESEAAALDAKNEQFEAEIADQPEETKVAMRLFNGLSEKDQIEFLAYLSRINRIRKQDEQIDKLMARIDRLPPDEQKSVDRLINKLLSRKKGKGNE